MDKIIKDFIKRSLLEDIGHGDITSLACIQENTIGEAQLIAKEDCRIAGIEIAKHIYTFYDQKLHFQSFVKNGENVKKNQKIFSISGSQKSILATERLVLNCMQRMSGIATKTNLFVQKVKDLKTKILDTRKTCPSIRFLDKIAVKIGGGENHRHGLYDVMMIKDNHIDFSGSIKQAILNCQKYINKKNIKIIIEVRDFLELDKVLQIGQIDRILLDNFTIEETQKAVEIVNKKYSLESSGNMNLDNIRPYAMCGVNYISIGSLTHSVKNIDLSMQCI